jgi:DNA modification methylase
MWTNCYDDSWQGLIVPEAFSHPAKMSRRLLERILDHDFEMGWIKQGDIICDPFAGIFSTGILGAYRKLQVVGVELEAKFCKLAEENLKLHDNAWRKLGCPRPVILQGDSRKLSQLIGQAGLIISSPPYAEMSVLSHDQAAHCSFKEGNPNNRVRGKIKRDGRHQRDYGQTEGQLGSMKAGNVDCVISSPPYADNAGSKEELGGQVESGMVRTNPRHPGEKLYFTKYEKQNSTGNLGNLKSGSVDVVISSPPYAESLKGDGTQNETASESRAKRLTEGGSLGQSQRTQGYGSKGNLGNLKSGSVDAILLSPPYEKQQVGGGIQKSLQGKSDYPVKDGLARSKKAGCSALGCGYGNQGDSEGQLGSMKAGNVDCVISSPPYASGQHQDSNDDKSIRPPHDSRNNSAIGLGDNPRNLGNLKSGSVDAILSSPPYEKSETGGQIPKEKYPQIGGRIFGYRQEHQGCSEGQLGQEQGETFWQAAKEIVSECYKILKDGGYAIWVVKSFVRNKKIVDFPSDWRRMCEVLGFVTVCEHHASLVKETKHNTLFEGEVTKIKEKKSFFRRLCESKGSPKIDYETVLCFRKEN